MSNTSPQKQTTVSSASAWIRGVYLDQDRQTAVRFLPADPDEGIVFVRGDVKSRPEIRCRPESLRSMPRWTSLESDENWVHHTEHVLAALALASVDNVRVEMDSDRLPMTEGGTCEAFYQALLEAGRVAQSAPRTVYRLKESVFWMDAESTTGERRSHPTVAAGRYIMGTPADALSVSTVFHWSHMPRLPVGVGEFEAGTSADVGALLSSRSYLVETEKEQVRSLLGAVRDQVMQLYPDCPSDLAHEAARHKIVDFIGDMMVLGRPLCGRFVAIRAGHRIHHDALKHMLANDLLECVPCEG